MTGKYSINLLQGELLPEHPLLTLPRVLSIWVMVFIVMVFIALSFQGTERSLDLEATKLTTEKQQQEQKLTTLKAQLASHKPSTELIAKEQTLKSIIANKKTIHNYLTNTDDSYIDGFANAMSDLALLHHKNISLTDIRINEHFIRFGGIARSPEAVPTWLTNFERSKVLSGRLFNHFQLNENENKYIEFTVSSFLQKEQD
ncbi:PilN domain-containing protein [Thalassotalea atypica]|uniref:PilN domain-containing protein n=1 Tax=Thalassotalea atypica TaxID=2054316 RepID=UPI002574884F|nr:PilN domain-containing protein [Thalassotalea atypica]